MNKVTRLRELGLLLVLLSAWSLSAKIASSGVGPLRGQCVLQGSMCVSLGGCAGDCELLCAPGPPPACDCYCVITEGARAFQSAASGLKAH